MSAWEIVCEALAQLPAQCRYHGDEIEPTRYIERRFSGACCATGEPALLRRRAEQALKQLRPMDEP